VIIFEWAGFKDVVASGGVCGRILEWIDDRKTTGESRILTWRVWRWRECEEYKRNRVGKKKRKRKKRTRERKIVMQLMDMLKVEAVGICKS